MFVITITIIILMSWITHDRKTRWPELEPEVIKNNQAERKKLRLLELTQQEEQIQKQDEEYRRQNE